MPRANTSAIGANSTSPFIASASTTNSNASTASPATSKPIPYKLNVGDVIQVESFTDNNLNRELVIQPDGTVTLRLIGEVRAATLTVQELREKLDDQYSKYYKLPSITVTPIKVNTKLDDLRATVDNRAGVGGQGRTAKVTPQGTIDLPGLNNIPAQGLTLDELKLEIDLRYKEQLGIQGVEVTPILTQRARAMSTSLAKSTRPAVSRWKAQPP